MTSTPLSKLFQLTVYTYDRQHVEFTRNMYARNRKEAERLAQIVHKVGNRPHLITEGITHERFQEQSPPANHSR